ncbi:MAG: DM13 domain-containing protein [Pseudomonadota bacterium]
MIKSVPIALTVAALLLAACAPAPKQAASAAPAIAASEAANANRTAKGTFVGKSDHITTGGASIARIGKQWVVILEDDFSFDGAPDPHVALGQNGYDKNASLAILASNSGKQVYAIPEGLDVANFNEIWIWCDKFTVPLGVAKLTLS